ncbi:hypothetical protein HK405_004048 [Cladochytrium tenue]|nr:hypothetical protein HK405_004048 [Cladochytrium tenue]
MFNTAAAKLRKRLETPPNGASTDIVVAPGVYDGFSARIALQVGFDCLYMFEENGLGGGAGGAGGRAEYAEQLYDDST